jgi:hypothetical protein
MRIGMLMMAAISLLGHETWPDKSRDFAATAKRLAQEGNTFASKFWVTENAAGYHAPDYREILSLMHSATIIEYGSQRTDTFRVLISSRGARHLLRRMDASEAEIADAKTFLLAHWEEATGRPWKEPVSA